MDHNRFDDLARRISRRDGLRAALAALAAAALAADPAGARKRRCRRDSPPGQCCRKDGTCTCRDGGTVCGANCCLIGQACQSGQCVEEPEPPACVEFGRPCKGVGAPCCDGLACGSGQGGKADVACYVPAGGACDATAECTFASTCRKGVCVADPPAPTCAPSVTAGPNVLENGARLAAAVAGAASGSTIFVGPGEYRLAATIVIDGRALRLAACEPGRTTISADIANTTGLIDAVNSDLSVEGFAFVGNGIN